MNIEPYIPEPVEPSLTLSLKQKLGLPDNFQSMHFAITRGFKVDIVALIAHEAALTESEIFNALNLPRRAVVQRRKHQRFNAVESNRIYALIEVITEADELFEGNQREAIQWLRKPCPALGQRSPIQNLNSFFEFQQVISLTQRLAHGVFN